MRYNPVEHTIESDKGETLLSFTKLVDTRTAYAVLDNLESSLRLKASYLAFKREHSYLRAMVDQLKSELETLKATVKTSDLV